MGLVTNYIIESTDGLREMKVLGGLSDIIFRKILAECQTDGDASIRFEHWYLTRLP